MTEPINPFTVPDFDSPMQPLRPFKFPHHDDLYVPVDDSERQYELFQTRMGTLRSLVDDGRIALVGGYSGCGKTALVNRCAAWVVRTMEQDLKITTAVIDATRTLDNSEHLELTARIAKVCDQLYDLVLDHEQPLLKPDALVEFKDNRAEPHRVFRNLGRWLLDGHALVLLLPRVELTAEVIAYARWCSRRVLFMVESPWIDAKGAESIVKAVGGFTMPVTLRVGSLADGDVKRYAETRLNGFAPRGRFPRMSEETLRQAGGKIDSVGFLQRCLQHTYEFRMSQDHGYEDDDWVTMEDVKMAISRLLGPDEAGTP